MGNPLYNIVYNKCSCGNPTTCTQCNTCSNCCICSTCTPIDPCNICASNPCSCTTIPNGLVIATDCSPVPCAVGCNETISSDCVILETYCYLNGCPCDGAPISLTAFLSQLCAELKQIDIDIACLKTQMPACSSDMVTCGIPVITNMVSDNTVQWTPALNNIGQKVAYRLTGTTTWSYSDVLLPQVNTLSVAGNSKNPLLQNALYDFQILSLCQTNQVSSIVRYFSVSGLSFNSHAMGADTIYIGWNLPDISNITSIKVSLYLGLTLINSHTFSSSTSGNYVFTGLTTSTAYTVVYGCTFNTQSFPQLPYNTGTASYLTANQSLTEFKNQSLVLTY